MAVSEIEKQLAPQADMSEVRQGSDRPVSKKGKKKGKKGEEEVTDGEKCKCNGSKSCSKCKKDTYMKRDSLTASHFRVDACWKGYTQIGMKMKGGKRVPNCVPAGTKKKADGAGCSKKRSVWADGYKPDQKMLSIDSSCSRK